MNFSFEDLSSAIETQKCSGETQTIDKHEDCKTQDCSGPECCQQCHFQTFLMSKTLLINPYTFYCEDFVKYSPFKSSMLFEIHIPPINLSSIDATSLV